MDFDFITDDKFRSILKRDFEELEICLNSKSSKSVLILAGSIIEAVLIDYFLNFPPPSIDEKKILSSDLNSLIDMAYAIKLISARSKDLSSIVRTYRNLIHPGREIRKNESFNYDSAIVAKSLLNIIVNEIRENYLTQIGYKAVDIIYKLEDDSISEPIFEKIINKLHKNEKIRLYRLLIDYDFEVDVKVNHLQQPKKYLNILKHHVERGIIIEQLLRLTNKVETGQQWEVMIFFYLLHEEIGLLDNSNTELVILYILNVLSESCKNESELKKYVRQNLFSVSGNYLISEQIESEFLNLAINIVNRYDPKDSYLYFQAYDQVVNSIDNIRKEKLKRHLLKVLSKYTTDDFYNNYNDGDYLPF